MPEGVRTHSDAEIIGAAVEDHLQVGILDSDLDPTETEPLRLPFLSKGVATRGRRQLQTIYSVADHGPIVDITVSSHHAEGQR